MTDASELDALFESIALLADLVRRGRQLAAFNREKHQAVLV